MTRPHATAWPPPAPTPTRHRANPYLLAGVGEGRVSRGVQVLQQIEGGLEVRQEVGVEGAGWRAAKCRLCRPHNLHLAGDQLGEVGDELPVARGSQLLSSGAEREHQRKGSHQEVRESGTCRRRRRRRRCLRRWPCACSSSPLPPMSLLPQPAASGSPAHVVLAVTTPLAVWRGSSTRTSILPRGRGTSSYACAFGNQRCAGACSAACHRVHCQAACRYLAPYGTMPILLHARPCILLVATLCLDICYSSKGLPADLIPT